MSAFPAFGSSNRTASGTPFYVTNEGVTGPGGLSAYSMGSDGTITAAGTFNTGGGPSGIAISPNGSYLYVTNFSGSPGVSAYTIGSGGALTAITTGTFADRIKPEWDRDQPQRQLPLYDKLRQWQRWFRQHIRVQHRLRRLPLPHHLKRRRLHCRR